MNLFVHSLHSVTDVDSGEVTSACLGTDGHWTVGVPTNYSWCPFNFQPANTWFLDGKEIWWFQVYQTVQLVKEKLGDK